MKVTWRSPLSSTWLSRDSYGLYGVVARVSLYKESSNPFSISDLYFAKFDCHVRSCVTPLQRFARQTQHLLVQAACDAKAEGFENIALFGSPLADVHES